MKRQYVDMLRHQALRKQLVETVKAKGITDEKVLEAMMQVPRHFFMDSALELTAYEDRAFPIAAGQTISQPYTVAYQSQLLEVKPFERILEVGTGSAYQATILAEMKAQVFTIERQKELYQLRAVIYPFEKRYANLKFFLGDGFKGLPTYAPFHKILITAAAPFIPEKLLEQLKPGGMMVIPVNEGGDAQRMMRIKKQEDGSLLKEAFDLFKFVPMLSGRK